MRCCRGKYLGPVSHTWTTCSLPEHHREPHFHDGIETYLVWRRRGQRYVHVESVYNAMTRKVEIYRTTLRSGRTDSADPWVLRLLIKARQARCARSTAHRGADSRRCSRTLMGLINAPIMCRIPRGD